MSFFAFYEIIPQDIVKFTRPRNNFIKCGKRRKKQITNFRRHTLMFRKILLLLIPNAENNITFQLRESSLKSSTARLRKLIRIGLIRINLRSAISAALTRSNRMLFSAFGISFILTLTLATQAEGSILEKKWEEDRTKIADSEQ